MHSFVGVTPAVDNCANNDSGEGFPTLPPPHPIHQAQGFNIPFGHPALQYRVGVCVGICVIAWITDLGLIVDYGLWTVHCGSQVLGHRLQIFDHGLWIEGHRSWIVDYGFGVVGYGWNALISSMTPVLEWCGSVWNMLGASCHYDPIATKGAAGDQWDWTTGLHKDGLLQFHKSYAYKDMIWMVAWGRENPPKFGWWEGGMGATITMVKGSVEPLIMPAHVARSCPAHAQSLFALLP